VSQPQTWPHAWYPDPTGRHDHRWWDGEAWTAHIADAGLAGIDPLGAGMPGPDEGRAEASGPILGPGEHLAPLSDPDLQRRAGRMGSWSAAIGITALPIALLPMFGLVPAGTGLALALKARSRLGRGGLAPSGAATLGLITSSLALGLALITTAAFIWLLTSTGTDGLPALFRTYLDCVETRSVSECRAELERGLAALLGP
jgi:hypothetical protein